MSQRFQFHRELYSREALLKSAYQYIDDFYLHLDADDCYYYVDISSREGDTDVDEKAFVNEILLQETRKLVEDRTRELRTVMYKRALASTVIETPGIEDDSPGEDADGILTDWFDEYEE